MRAITPEDLKLVAPTGVEPDITTVTVTAPRSTFFPPFPGTWITEPPLPPPPPGINPPCMPAAARAIQQLTKDNEAAGPSDPALAHGVIPGNPGSTAFASSGVTVSYGFDLAQHYGSDLASAGLGHGVIEQLRPFLASILTLESAGLTTVIPRKGPRGQQAHDLLGAFPINPPLSNDVVQSLFDFAYGRAFNSAVNGFQSLTGGIANFFTLPAAAQSVLTDLTYQYGSLTSSNFPSDMRAAIASQDWSALASSLQKQGKRGANDAAVLRAAMQANQLPLSGACSG